MSYSDNPLISVIVPVYNSKNSLERCLDSILAQTFKNFECILVDDGSTDNSLDTANDYALKDNRVVVIHQENTGVSAARNKGIAVSQGTYIMFADSDDHILPDMMQKLYDTIETYRCDVVCCGYEHRGKIYSLLDGLYEISQAETVYRLEKNELFGLIWNKLYSAKILKDGHIQFPVGLSFGEDMFFNLYYFARVEKVFFIHDPLYIYCENPVSITKKRPSFELCLFRFRNVSKGIISLIELDGKNYINKILAMDFTYTVFLIRCLYYPQKMERETRNMVLHEIKIFYQDNPALHSFRSIRYFLFYSVLMILPLVIFDISASIFFTLTEKSR
jgi:glycosyltransferase involved in cell wall biosynthesis